ncbi:MAG: hypothetical protein GX878_11560 [Firmicutes bacterium]|nr:hypothetical protein [Bacillota bacterium]
MGKYEGITKYIQIIEDHGHLFMYYGTPYSDECDVYDDEKDGQKLVVSHECHDLCSSIADEFEKDYEWHDIKDQLNLEDLFDVDLETQNLDIIIPLLLYLVWSVSFEDKFIDALNNGYLVRLLKRLESLSK